MRARAGANRQFSYESHRGVRSPELFSNFFTPKSHQVVAPSLEEEEEEEDLFVFNDTIEGPRASAVKPGRVPKVLKRSS